MEEELPNLHAHRRAEFVVAAVRRIDKKLRLVDQVAG
jgi:hypothetical protein